MPVIFLGWWTFKENRIVSGDSLGLADVFTWAFPIALLLLWLGGLTAASLLRGKTGPAVFGLAANIILVLAFLLTGLAADRLLAGEPPAARVSMGAGFWLSIVACYIAIFAAREKLKDSAWLYHTVSWSGLAVCIGLVAAGWLNNISILEEFMGREDRFIQEFFHHIYLVGVSVAIGTVLGMLLGFWATRSRRAEKPVFWFASITQTIPSLALFGLLIAPLSALSFAYPWLRELGVRGVGDTPAIIALVIYSLLPIVRNTYVGLKNVDEGVIDSGRGMGMSGFQIFRRIEAPLAAPLVLEGVRTAAVQSVGLAAVAALIGAGGLGWFIFQGLGQAAPDLILLGVIPIIFLALIIDTLMRTAVMVATPRGLAGAVR